MEKQGDKKEQATETGLCGREAIFKGKWETSGPQTQLQRMLDLRECCCKSA